VPMWVFMLSGARCDSARRQHRGAHYPSSRTSCGNYYRGLLATVTVPFSFSAPLTTFSELLAALM